MGLRLFFWPNFLGATFIQGATIIPDSRVDMYTVMRRSSYGLSKQSDDTTLDNHLKTLFT